MSDLLPPRLQGCLSDLRLDGLLAGELTEEDARTAEQHLEMCATCRARHQGLQADQRAFALTPPRLALPEQPPARTSVWLRRPWLWSATGAVAAAAAAVLLLRPSAPDLPATRTKGGASLGFFVKRGESVFPGSPGERLRPGDRLRFTGRTTEARYLAIVSVDAAGVPSLYFPDIDQPYRLEAGGDVPLPGATELDDTLGVETLHGIFCAEAVAPSSLLAAVRGAPDRPGVPDGCEDVVLSFVKAHP